MQSFLIKIGFLFALLAAFGCASQQAFEQQRIPEADNRYDSEFPIKSISKELDYVSNAIKKIDCIAFYQSYVFYRNNTLDQGPITESALKTQAYSISVSNESVTGTATVVYYDGRTAGLITCAHIVDFPDTVILRYDEGEGPIEVLSVKIKQQNYINELPEGDDVEVLALDKKNDIAFLTKSLDEHVEKISVLNYPLGNTKDIEWGSIVYIMGYPLGNKMVTRAIVSNPARTNKNRFMTDALYNRGISGSPVLAIRDGVPNLEWIGVAASASVQNVYYLKPGNDDPELINPDELYTGESYVDQKKIINYGVSFNISIEAVVDFLNHNRKLLESRRIDLKMLFK